MTPFRGGRLLLSVILLTVILFNDINKIGVFVIDKEHSEKLLISTD